MGQLSCRMLDLAFEPNPRHSRDRNSLRIPLRAEACTPRNSYAAEIRRQSITSPRSQKWIGPELANDYLSA